MTTLLFSPYGMRFRHGVCTPDNTRTECAQKGPQRHMRSHHNYNTAPANILKTETGYELQLSLPGYTRENISIQVLNDVLSIEGKLDNTAQETKKMLHKEFSTREFKRSFTIGDTLDADSVDASFQHGILKIKIAFKPAPEAPKPTNITVQ